MAGFFRRLWNKITRKKTNETVVEEISKKNEENRIFKDDNSQDKFNIGLNKSSSALQKGIDELVRKYKKIDDDFFDDLEEFLISYDIGYTATKKITDNLKDQIAYHNVEDPKLIKEIFADSMFTYYINNSTLTTDINLKDGQTNVVLVVGANGVGKTTTIAKITWKYVKEHKKVLLVAGDTFRAGAVAQLKVWADKFNVDIVLPERDGQDPASLIYQGVQKGYAENYDLVICDTSGRLQNKVNLMNELNKIYNVIHKFDEIAPHETLLVLDATTGQSALSQAKAFSEVANITGIVLTKMDSTSKGGIIFAIKDMFDIPVKFIGLGETIDDLQVFDLPKFVDGMLFNFEKIQQEND